MVLFVRLLYTASRQSYCIVIVFVHVIDTVGLSRNWSFVAEGPTTQDPVSKCIQGEYAWLTSTLSIRCDRGMNGTSK